MKKIALMLLTVFSAFLLTACAGSATLPSYSTPWADNPVYEQSSYRATRDKVSGEPGAYAYETVAEGTQTITLREGTQADTIVFTVERKLTYVVDDVLSDEKTIAAGTESTYLSELVFSCAPTTMMQVLSSSKKIVNGADPSTDLDYTVTYDLKEGLKIVDHLDEGKETAYKAGKVKNAFDNDMWYLLVRYGADFGKGWTSAMSLISIADSLYKDELIKFNLTATAADSAQNLPLPALSENIRLSENDVFAKENEEEPGKFYAPALEVTISNPGEMGSIRGPSIHAHFITDRRVDRLPLANLMLEYRQDEFTPDGRQTYRNLLSLTGAEITETV